MWMGSHKLHYRVVLLFLLITANTVCAKTYLVSVGIADYPGTNNDLALPTRDATTITALYSRNSQVTYKQLLNAQASRKNILSALRTVFAQAGSNDIVVFFFSGHGYEGGLVAYDGLLSYTEVRKAMAKSKSRNKMIFADACFSGQFRQEASSSSQTTSSYKKANVMLFLSSRSNETSIESPGMSNGFFTTYLQKGLRGNADANRDRVITARELFNFVQQGVVSLSHGRQHPVMWGNFSDNMPVMRW